jgi:hypothetical protein
MVRAGSNAIAGWHESRYDRQRQFPFNHCRSRNCPVPSNSPCSTCSKTWPEAMAADERHEEQQFLAELKARSGRDLAEWMAAIAAQNFTDKNETIDWLRGQGFAFARASWLERIHSNGGRPIYQSQPERAIRAREKPPPRRRAEAPTVTVAAAAEAANVTVPAAAEAANVTVPAAAEAPTVPVPAAAAAPTVPVAVTAADQLATLIAAAKGYRPLYLLLESEVRAHVPGMIPSPASTHISFGAPAEFAAVALNAAELRLGLALGDRAFDQRLQRARLKGAKAQITHMVVLTDARQVNADLLSLVRAANVRING